MNVGAQLQKYLRRVGMVAAFSMLYSMSSFGAVITVDGGSCCASFNWDTNTKKLSCVAQQTPPPSTGTPVCTLTATTNSITAGTPVTIRVGSCNPAATTYRWSANTNFGTAATTGNGSSITGGVVVPTSTTTYSVQGVNASGVVGTAATTTLNVTTPPPIETPVCTLAATTNSVIAGTPVTIRVSNCSPAATTYRWSDNTGFGTAATTGDGSSITSGVVMPTSTTTYSVRGVNAGGRGTAATTTLTVR